jgi:hypothetical protein
MLTMFTFLTNLFLVKPERKTVHLSQVVFTAPLSLSASLNNVRWRRIHQ